MKLKLLVTDLDGTLYSWEGFYVPAFYAMAEKTAQILGLPLPQILSEYRQVHRKKHCIEYPFSTFLLPSVQKAYPDADEDEKREIFKEAFHAFNRIRKEKLSLYPNVEGTLRTLKASSVKLAGYTDSGEANGVYRLQKLGIDSLFDRFYVSDIDFERPDGIRDPRIRRVECTKPDPEMLGSICRAAHVRKEETLYIGDSMTKDILMASDAGVRSALCAFPKTDRDRENGEKLAAISSWTGEDFERERLLEERCRKEHIRPDYVISDFAQVLTIAQEYGEEPCLA